MSTNYINPKVEYVDKVNGFQIMRKLEKCARTCYQSESKQHTNSTADFLRGIIKSGHTSVLEHESITLDIVTNRGTLAELTRHRIGVGYSVESTRYVNYKDGVEFIFPIDYVYDTDIDKDTQDKILTRIKIFKEACDTAAHAYAQLIKNGAKPQEARAVLPQALKVDMKVTMNIRAWRHFFELRCAPSAHPDIKEIAIAILLEFRKKMLPLFEDIKYDEDFYINHKVRIDSIFHTPTKTDEVKTRNVLYEMELIDNNGKLHEKTQKSINDVEKTYKDAYANPYDSIFNWMKDHEEYMKSRDQEKVDKMTAAMDLDEKKEYKKSVNEAFDELGNVFSKMEEEYQKTKKEPLRDYEHRPRTRRELENEKLVRDIEEMLNKHATRMEELSKLWPISPTLSILDEILKEL